MLHVLGRRGVQNAVSMLDAGGGPAAQPTPGQVTQTRQARRAQQSQQWRSIKTGVLAMSTDACC